MKNKNLILIFLIIVFVFIMLFSFLSKKTDDKLYKKYIENLPVKNIATADVVNMLSKEPTDENYKSGSKIMKDINAIDDALGGWFYNDDEVKVMSVIGSLDSLSQVKTLFDEYRVKKGIDLYKVLLYGESSGMQNGFDSDEVDAIKRIILSIKNKNKN
jgi:hypothetical protein